MTALAALIQQCEAPEPMWVEHGQLARPGAGQIGITDELWEMPITIKAWNAFSGFRDEIVNLAFEAWRNRIAHNVQAQQLAAGIPVETIQEAIDRGYYSDGMVYTPDGWEMSGEVAAAMESEIMQQVNAGLTYKLS